MTEKTYDVAVVGATDLVGEAIIEHLGVRGFPVGTLYPLAAGDAAGGRVQFCEKSISIRPVEDFDFSRVQIAFFADTDEVSAKFVPKAAGAGCVAIDTSAEFRNDEDVPLVVPEVNPELIRQYNQSNIIASPDCPTVQMVVALKPIYDAVGIDRINVLVQQSASALGRDAVEELAAQTAALLNMKPIKSSVFSKQIAFNSLPCTDQPLDHGYTKDEQAIIDSTKKIFADSELKVNPSISTIPVFFGCSQALHIETKNKISVDAVTKLVSLAPSVKLIEGDCPTVVTDAVGKDSVFVGRVREDLSCLSGLDLWVVADNVRKGAALNSIQIAQILIKEYL